MPINLPRQTPLFSDGTDTANASGVLLVDTHLRRKVRYMAGEFASGQATGAAAKVKVCSCRSCRGCNS